ncbi:MAG: T9SS type A sorting domain-containing protein [Bacteroidetes bacterium]|nr:T9SS type A sorting domain-containing protein [Bacteroidota bacterium]
MTPALYAAFGQCPSVGGLRTQVLTAIDTAVIQQNYGVICPDFSDCAVQSIVSAPLRPGAESRIFILSGNIDKVSYGATPLTYASGYASTSLIGPVHYVRPAPGALIPTSAGPLGVRYNVNLDNIYPGAFDIIVATDSSAAPHDQICIDHSIPVAYAFGTSELDQSDNRLLLCSEVREAAYDPNYKEVFPTSLIDVNTWLTYTIQFQNTSTDTAHTIVIRDTLSPLLDVSTFEFLASSHPVSVKLVGYNMTLTYTNINLPDSTMGTIRSSGWIQYRVKAWENVPARHSITNTAHISIDQSPALVTNTVKDSVLICKSRSAYIVTTMCQGDTFIFLGRPITTTGRYYDSLIDMRGCDSVTILVLTVNSSYPHAGSDTQTVCGPLQYGNYLHTQSGDYIDTLYTIYGCDSVVTLHLTIYPEYYDTVTASVACSQPGYSFRGKTYNITGTYTDSLHTIYGCDSFFTLRLTVAAQPVRLRWDYLVYTGYLQRYDAEVHWCPELDTSYFELNGGTPVGGVYSGQYVSGRYFDFHSWDGTPTIDTLLYTYTDAIHGCTDSAMAYLYIGACSVGINDPAQINTLRIYPNPNMGTFTLEAPNMHDREYIITDMLGAVIDQEAIASDKQVIFLNPATAGVYTLTIKGLQPVKFVIVR